MDRGACPARGLKRVGHDLVTDQQQHQLFNEIRVRRTEFRLLTPQGWKSSECPVSQKNLMNC